jgi:hypothetical protein
MSAPSLSARFIIFRMRGDFSGLPARSYWMGLKDRVAAGVALNEMVARGEVSAPIVVTRDHISSGSVARPSPSSSIIADRSTRSSPPASAPMQGRSGKVISRAGFPTPQMIRWSGRRSDSSAASSVRRRSWRSERRFRSKANARLSSKAEKQK